MYYYRVECWVAPKSGFDLVEKNKAFRFIESIAEKLVDDAKEKILAYLEGFKGHTNGMVLKTFNLESDSKVRDPEKELMAEIRKNSPEAVLADWGLVDASITKKRM
jgi:hypothetical protein